MKNFKLVLTITILVQIIIFSSCSKNDSEPLVDSTVNDTINDTINEVGLTTSIENFLDIKKAALANRTQQFQFDAATNGSIVTSSGVQISISGACLLKDGATVSGLVDVDVVELFERGDMLVTNKATMGVNADGDLEILKSGGEFYVNVTQDGDQIEITCAMQASIPTNLTGSPDNDMILWKGVDNTNCPTDMECDGIVWEKDLDENKNEQRVFVEEDNAAATRYYTTFGEFGWTNVDKFYNDPRPKTTLEVEIPAGYTDENSAVYLSYDGESNALAFLDEYDDDTKLFSEHYGQIPVGLDCHVIFASEDNGNWLYAIKSVTIAANATITISSNETMTGTEAQLVAAINGLP